MTVVEPTVRGLGQTTARQMEPQSLGCSPASLRSAGVAPQSAAVPLTHPKALRTQYDLSGLKFGVAQMNVKAGAVRENVARMLAFIKEAKASGCNVVVFPEMAVGGYLLADQYYRHDFCEFLMEQNDVIRKASKGITVVWGNLYHDTPERQRARGLFGTHLGEDDRTRRFNAVYVATDGHWAKRKHEFKLPNGASPLPPGVQPKALLPNYGVFDDSRYFYSLLNHARDMGCQTSDLVSPFLMGPGGNQKWLGASCCEDAWVKSYRANRKPINLAKMHVAQGAQGIINISASPFVIGKEQARDAAFAYSARDIGERNVPSIYCNRVGVDNNGKNIIPYDGQSTIYDATGKPIRIAPEPHREQLLVVDKLEGPTVERAEETPIAQKYRAIIDGIRHFKDTMGVDKLPKMLIGLSGGIDSAVVAALMEQAIGRENVIAVNLPSRYNSDATKDAAAHIAQELGIDYTAIPIEDIANISRKAIAEGRDRLNGVQPKKVSWRERIVRAYKERVLNIPKAEGEYLQSLTDENLQAKIRSGMILSTLAQEMGCLWSNNGNKVEVHLGYATLYGDWGGAIGPIGSLTKEEVMKLGRYINEKVYGREVIPQALYNGEIKPSAELKEDQVDPIKIGYHCRMLKLWTGPYRHTHEDFMRWYLNGTLHTKLGISVETMREFGMDDPKAFVKDLEWFLDGGARAVFKRVQSVPIIRTENGDYGWDIREAMFKPDRTREYLRLRNAVMTMEPSLVGHSEIYLPRGIWKTI